MHSFCAIILFVKKNPVKKEFTMFFYLATIIIATILICIANILFVPLPFANSALWVIVTVVSAVILEMAIDGLFAFIAHSFPKKWFDVNSKAFYVSRAERKFYEKLHIKAWKDKVMELGFLSGFSKSKVLYPNDLYYINRFIIECNKGFLGHELGIFLGFLILLFPLPKYWLSIGLPVALVNVFLNKLSSMVLRYNVPKLTVAYQRAEKLLERERGKENNENKKR